MDTIAVRSEDSYIHEYDSENDLVIDLKENISDTLSAEGNWKKILKKHGIMP